MTGTGAPSLGHGSPGFWKQRLEVADRVSRWPEWLSPPSAQGLARAIVLRLSSGGKACVTIHGEGGPGGRERGIARAGGGWLLGGCLVTPQRPGLVPLWPICSGSIGSRKGCVCRSETPGHAVCSPVCFCSQEAGPGPAQLKAGCCLRTEAAASKLPGCSLPRPRVSQNLNPKVGGGRGPAGGILID